MEQKGSVQHIDVSTQVHPLAATIALSVVSCLIALSS